MKRMWIGVGLLVLVLVSGILATNFMEGHTPGAADLNRAAKLALEEQWDTAEAFAGRAERDWQKKRPVTACFTEHEPMEAIDGMFAQLEVYAKARDAVAYSGTCAYLAAQLEAMGEIHKFTLWNLL